MRKSGIVFCLSLGLMASGAIARGQDARDADCFEIALRAKNARIRADRALARSAIAAARVEAELAPRDAAKSHSTSLTLEVPPRAPTPPSGTSPRELLLLAYRRVIAVSPAVFEFSAAALNRQGERSAKAEPVISEPHPDSEELNSFSCTAILARIEDQVFRFEQAMQLAEIAADQAIALAARRAPQP